MFEFVGNDAISSIDPDGRRGGRIWCACCVGALAYDVYEAFQDTCAGKTGPELTACITEQLLKAQGLGDLASCVASAILNGQSAEGTASKIGDCVKCHGISALGDAAKVVCCAQCGVKQLVPILAPALRAIGQ